MNLATLGSVGEIVSGIAVLVTLVYLAYQTKISVRMHEQSMKDLQSQIFSQNADGWVDFFMQLSMNERLSSIVGKLQYAMPLEESEISSADFFLTGLFLRLENTQYQGAEGNMTGVGSLLRKQVGVYSGSPDFSAWWLRAQHEGFTDWFVEAVNTILEPHEQDRTEGSERSN